MITFNLLYYIFNKKTPTYCKLTIISDYHKLQITSGKG